MLDIKEKRHIQIVGKGGGGQAESVEWNDILNKPEFATVATSGDYDDLTNKPTILTQWFGTQAEYDAITVKDPDTIYNIEGSDNVQPDWNQSDTTADDYIKNKPTIPAAQVNSDWNANSGVAQILNKPTLATVATTGNYSDLNGTPTIPAAQVNADWNANSGVAQILNKPTIPTVPTMATETLTFTLQGGTTKTIDFYTVPDYFYIENRTNSNGTFTIKKTAEGAPSIQIYSSTDRINWTDMGTTSTSAMTISLPANGKTYLKATANNWGGVQNYNYINTNYNCNVGGNIMSLLYGDSFVNKTTFPTNSTYTFNRLFVSNTHIISAENLILPATTLVQNCYSCMFEGCTKMTTAPALPATTLAQSCYSGMFSTCRALTTAPVLPATTLTSYCYYEMFYYCTALTTAPVLPATTLTSYCYYGMFNICSSLNNITIYANNISASECLKGWVNGVAATGDFFKLGSASFPSGNNGIPSGWTTHTSL